MRGQSTTLQSPRRVLRVGSSGQKIATQAEKEANPAIRHVLDCLDRIGAMFFGRSEIKLTAELFHEHVAHVLANAHGAITLHIGMAAHRTRTRAGAANVTTEQEKIHHLLNSRDGILVLGQTHRPAADDPFTAHRNLRRCANLITSQAAASEDVFPIGRAKMFDKRFETDGLSLNKFAIEN